MLLKIGRLAYFGGGGGLTGMGKHILSCKSCPM